MVTSAKDSRAISVQVRDSVRRRVFIAPLGTLFTLESGAFDSFVFYVSRKRVQLTITAAPRGVYGAANAPAGRILVSQTAKIAGVRSVQPSQTLKRDAGAYVVPFTGGTGTISFNVV